MSVSSEVQRTLVKSPPELWAELSDPAALARHLGELGEIRIVRTVPETTVEWEAAEVAGRVHIKPSAWGTKVTLSVTGELPRPSPERSRSGPEEHKPESEGGRPESDGQKADSGGHKPHSGGHKPDSEGHKGESEPDESESEGGNPESDGQSQSAPVSPACAQLGAGDPAVLAPETATSGPKSPELISAIPSVGVDAADSQSSVPAGECAGATQPQVVGGSESSRGSEPLVRPRRRLFRRAWRRLLRGRPAEDASAASDETSLPDADRVASPPGGSQAIEPAPGASIADSAPQKDDPKLLGPVAAAPDPVATEQPATEKPATEKPANASIEPAANGFAEPPENVSSEQPANAPAKQPENPSAGLDTTGEGAAEQLTAVLVSVLDRLGAAHHRPFSRA